MPEEFLEIIAFLKSSNCEKIGIFSHQNADPDAISSSIALKELLLNLVDRNLEIKLFASSLNSLAENLLQKTNEKIIERVDEYDFDAIFLCDTNNLIQLGDAKILEDFINTKPIFIIDHHSKNNFTNKAKNAIIKQHVSSTAEIVTEIYYELKLKPSQAVATLLLAGIIFDSRRFIYLSDFTFKAVQFLMDCGGNYEDALQTLYIKQTFSEKIARLKGAQRILLHKMENDILVISHSNSFESSVARALIELGASCSAVLAKPSQDEYRLSLRCTKDFAEKNAINLGDIANSIALEIGGSGGGHETAAGVNFTNIDVFPKNKNEALKFILNLILNHLESSNQTNN